MLGRGRMCCPSRVDGDGLQGTTDVVNLRVNGYDNDGRKSSFCTQIVVEEKAESTLAGVGGSWVVGRGGWRR